ncbi:UDP-forming cellulose synthase catalytic subunit [Agrobacterium genomosp. 3 str. CIP 111-78]|uniref:Cellulose synthase catalytic subunit [UDP-forming] n=1 Tax=Agrobacterium tumefaciens TaxID=358 RepID=A0AAE6BPC4_AGRTU|nr:MULTISPECIES: UDP-forming cellulose synthase catalytic subunit [Agrobacterium tumefaciens complex]MCA2372460.1 UDP-forming cellulose synthase catalytic subunit [Agrobacterium tomkonis CIP 111-78]QCM01807.1 UDP-forming cellulose synthase catalytic subunit [Agrobacterium tumefaciens]
MNKAITVIVWLLVSLCVLAIITMPVSLQTHLVATAISLVLLATIKGFNGQGAWRLVALGFGTAIVLRYVYWRTTSTLPPVNQLENFIPGFLLYLAEMYSVLMLGLSLVIVSMPLPSRKTQPGSPDYRPTVDVFVPSYNEDAELLANTLAAAKNMDYPADRFTVWLLDDGGSVQKRNASNIVEAQAAQRRHEELKKLCEDLDVRYLTRERNVHAKAGNLNNGLAHSTGELVTVFDADHAPARDFLLETVGYFEEDPRLFLVQTPHFFVNPDPIERNLRTFETMPSENEMFYGIIQRGLDKWNGAFFCGSAAVLRREALQDTEGFSGVSITEDCETALALHSRGWNSIYVDKPLIAGLQPATFASFIGQRSRWAQGMMQILIFRQPLFKRGLSFTQRLCYMSSTLFWLFPFPRTIFLFAPLFYLFFDLQIFVASGGEFLAYTAAYMLVNLMMQNYLYGSFRWPWISELYEYVQTVHLLPAVVSVIFNPGKPTFKVTAKDESIAEARLSEISRPFFVIFALLVVAMAFAIWRIYSEPYKADVTLVVGGWNLLNLIFAGCALGVVSERGDKSASRRITVKRRCEVKLEGSDAWVPASIDNVSVHGLLINLFDSATTVEKDTTAIVKVKPHSEGVPETMPVKVVRTVRGEGLVSIGCTFSPQRAVDHRLIADLIFANSEQWSEFQRVRRRNPGLIRGTAIFLAISLFQTQRGLFYLAKALRPAAKSVKPAGAVK